MTESRMVETIQRLVSDGEIPQTTADRLKSALYEKRHESQYIIGHLCAHLAIGLIFSFDLIPLPLGTITRGVWVAVNRVAATARGQRDRAKVHSFPVLIVSLIPFVGYFAYLIPLRESNADAAYVYANHITYLRGDCSLRQFILRRPAWQQRLLRSMLAAFLVQPQDDSPADNR